LIQKEIDLKAERFYEISFDLLFQMIAILPFLTENESKNLAYLTLFLLRINKHLDN